MTKKNKRKWYVYNRSVDENKKGKIIGLQSIVHK